MSKPIVPSKTSAMSYRTRFYIQLARDSKASFKNVYVVTGNLDRAVQHYNLLLCPPGSKKRLIFYSGKKMEVLLSMKAPSHPIFQAQTVMTYV